MAAIGGTCKIFGFKLNTNHPTCDPVTSQSNANYVLESCCQLTGTLCQSSEIVEAGQSIEPSKSTKSFKSTSTSPEKKRSAWPKPDAVEALSRSTRSCIKVQNRGSAQGKSVDLSRFNVYDELIAEVDQIFEFEGELMSPNKNWTFLFTNSEADLMLIGDDPWHQEFFSQVYTWECAHIEFCGMVRKIYVFTKEEVQKINEGTLRPRSKETSTVAEEKSMEIEMENPLPTSATNPNKS